MIVPFAGVRSDLATVSPDQISPDLASRARQIRSHQIWRRSDQSIPSRPPILRPTLLDAPPPGSAHHEDQVVALRRAGPDRLDPVLRAVARVPLPRATQAINTSFNAREAPTAAIFNQHAPAALNPHSRSRAPAGAAHGSEWRGWGGSAGGGGGGARGGWLAERGSVRRVQQRPFPRRVRQRPLPRQRPLARPSVYRTSKVDAQTPSNSLPAAPHLKPTLTPLFLWTCCAGGTKQPAY